MSSLPDLYDPWGPIARAQGMIVMPEGTVTDDGAGNVTLGSTLLVMAGGGNDNWIRVAAGSHVLGQYDALCVDLPPTKTPRQTHAAYVDAYASTSVDEKFPHRYRLVLGVRIGAGRVAWRFPALERAANPVSNIWIELDDKEVTGSAAASVTLTIPNAAAYRALKIIANSRDTANGNQYLRGRINGDTGNNYDTNISYQLGATAGGVMAPNETIAYWGYSSGANNNAAVFTHNEITIIDPGSTTRWKTWCQVGNTIDGDNVWSMQHSGIWTKAPEPITSISFFGGASGGNLAVGSRYTAYGIV